MNVEDRIRRLESAVINVLHVLASMPDIEYRKLSGLDDICIAMNEDYEREVVSKANKPRRRK
jgi:hypothetical protein